MSTRTKILAVVAALGLLVIVLARGGESSPERQALEDDPLAAYVPPGGTLVDTDTRNAGTSLGKEVDATLTRLFQLRESAAPKALANARAAATAADWTITETTDRGFLAERSVSSGELALAVTLSRDSVLLPDDVEPPALSVSLSHLA